MFAVGDAPTDSASAAPTPEVACPGCPIGMLLDTYTAAQPEAFDHLLAAAAETVAALQVVLDSAQDTITAHRAALAAKAATPAPRTKGAASQGEDDDGAEAPPAPTPPRTPRRSPAATSRKKPPRVQHIDLA